MQPAPITSPDGQWIWDGTQWQPNPDAASSSSSATADTSTAGSAASTPAAAAAPDTSTGTAPAAAAPAPDPASTAYDGPKVGTVVGYTSTDPYSDSEVTRYGVVVGVHGRDTSNPESVDRAEIAWLPEGTALLDTADLEQL